MRAARSLCRLHYSLQRQGETPRIPLRAGDAEVTSAHAFGRTASAPVASVSGSVTRVVTLYLGAPRGLRLFTQPRKAQGHRRRVGDFSDVRKAIAGFQQLENLERWRGKDTLHMLAKCNPTSTMYHCTMTICSWVALFSQYC